MCELKNLLNEHHKVKVFSQNNEQKFDFNYFVD